MSTVLVTGGSGFIGSHSILQLIAAGHQVRTTVRDLKQEPAVRAVLDSGGLPGAADLTFYSADLMLDRGWDSAIRGCDYVLHVASPFPERAPKSEEELIAPAREGALRVLRASRDAGVHRVVMTSSFAAIGYGHPPRTAPFDETDWTDLTGRGVQAYPKSKTLAERAAWEFVGREGGSLELSVINPVMVLGPALSEDMSTSTTVVKRLMDGSLPGLPKLRFGIVDVRDVVDLHLRAMTDPAAAGERFIASAGDFLSLREIAMILIARLGPEAARVPTRELPNWVVRLVALINPDLKQVTPELGTNKNASNAKAKARLGWSPRSREDAIVATAESLIRLGIIKPK